MQKLGLNIFGWILSHALGLPSAQIPTLIAVKFFVLYIKDFVIIHTWPDPQRNKLNTQILILLEVDDRRATGGAEGLTEEGVRGVEEGSRGSSKVDDRCTTGSDRRVNSKMNKIILWIILLTKIVGVGYYNQQSFITCYDNDNML